MKVQIKYPKTKCQYCGKTFTKKHNRQVYCSTECKNNARKEKKRIYNSKYYYKNRQKLHTTLIGTRCIGPKPNPDIEREKQIVQNEIDRIGLRIF